MKKEKNNYLNKKILMDDKLIITLISIILIIIIPTSLSKIIKARNLLFTNEITLIINGIGNLTIISNINLIPSLIYINNEENPQAIILI